MATQNHNKTTTISKTRKRNENVEQQMPYREIQQKTVLARIKEDFRISRVLEIIVAIFIAIGFIGILVSDENDKECEYYKNNTQIPARCIAHFIELKK